MRAINSDISEPSGHKDLLIRNTLDAEDNISGGFGVNISHVYMLDRVKSFVHKPMTEMIFYFDIV